MAHYRPGTESVQPLSVQQLVLKLIQVLASSFERASFQLRIHIWLVGSPLSGSKLDYRGRANARRCSGSGIRLPGCSQRICVPAHIVGVQATVWPCRLLRAVRATHARQLVIQRLDAWSFARQGFNNLPKRGSRQTDRPTDRQTDRTYLLSLLARD